MNKMKFGGNSVENTLRHIEISRHFSVAILKAIVFFKKTIVVLKSYSNSFMQKLDCLRFGHDSIGIIQSGARLGWLYERIKRRRKILVFFF